MIEPDPGTERQALADPATHAHWRRDIIRFDDLDILGHVNNVAYMVYIETGRIAFLEHLGKPPRDRESGAAFVLAHVAVDYLDELNYPGDIHIGTTVLRIGNTSFSLGHGIFKDGECKATATSVLVQVQGRPGRPLPLTAEQKDLIRRVGEEPRMNTNEHE